MKNVFLIGGRSFFAIGATEETAQDEFNAVIAAAQAQDATPMFLCCQFNNIEICCDTRIGFEYCELYSCYLYTKKDPQTNIVRVRKSEFEDCVFKLSPCQFTGELLGLGNELRIYNAKGSPRHVEPVDIHTTAVFAPNFWDAHEQIFYQHAGRNYYLQFDTNIELSVVREYNGRLNYHLIGEQDSDEIDLQAFYKVIQRMWENKVIGWRENKVTRWKRF